jgi:hypothetical protein
MFTEPFLAIKVGCFFYVVCLISKKKISTCREIVFPADFTLPAD